MTKNKTQIKSTDDKKAQLLTSPTLMNAVAMEPFVDEILGDIPLTSISKALKANIATINSGDLGSIEAALLGQSQALQAMFVSLARKASGQTHINQYATLMNLALKAQNQSRASMQALVEIKSPKQVAFVKQTNIAHGHQQVNNTDNLNQTKNEPNELMEKQNEQWLDPRAQSATSKTN